MKTPPVALLWSVNRLRCRQAVGRGERLAVVPWLPLADGCTDCGVKVAVAPALGRPSRGLTSLSAAKFQCEGEDGRLVFVLQLVSAVSVAVAISSMHCCQV